MSNLSALLESGRYRAEVQRLGPVLARHELWREADRRARRIASRLAPVQLHRFEYRLGPEVFVAMQRHNARAKARHLMVLEYARDQILAKLERRVGVAQLIGDLA